MLLLRLGWRHLIQICKIYRYFQNLPSYNTWIIAPRKTKIGFFFSTMLQLGHRAERATTESSHLNIQYLIPHHHTYKSADSKHVTIERDIKRKAFTHYIPISKTAVQLNERWYDNDIESAMFWSTSLITWIVVQIRRGNHLIHTKTSFDAKYFDDFDIPKKMDLLEKLLTRKKPRGISNDTNWPLSISFVPLCGVRERHFGKSTNDLCCFEE